MAQQFFQRFPSALGLTGTAEVSKATAAVPETKQTLFVGKLIAAAMQAGKVFNINPLVILAQASLESGWGTSPLSVKYNNYFGITATGKPNAYWKGQSYTSQTSGLKFRVYDNIENGLMDFARMISAYYKAAAAASGSVSAYAALIANSPYISEKNGDNRENYKNILIKNAASIMGITKKKFPQTPLF